jgi:hypothetical protein
MPLSINNEEERGALARLIQHAVRTQANLILPDAPRSARVSSEVRNRIDIGEQPPDLILGGSDTTTMPETVTQTVLDLTAT